MARKAPAPARTPARRPGPSTGTGTASAGYSGTPLAKKLGIKPGATVRPIGAPPGYRALVEPLPDDVRFVTTIAAGTDIIHLFATKAAQLSRELGVIRATMRPDAAVWVSWPKKAAKLPTDVTEDVVRALALPLGFVDVKVCAVDEVWSGLKLVVRKTLR